MAKCTYKSKENGLMLPVHQEINGISVPNLEPHNTELVNLFIKSKMTHDKKARKQLEEDMDL